MKKDILEQLYKDYYNEAKIYVYSLCHNIDIAEDIVMDAFYKALVSLNDNIEHFKYWLLRVCKNLYIDYCRKKKKETLVPVESIDLCDEVSILNELITEEKYKAIYYATCLLEDDYKEVIMLFYFQSLSVSEIGLIMNKSIENIKVLLYRSREKLKKILEDKNEF